MPNDGVRAHVAGVSQVIGNPFHPFERIAYGIKVQLEQAWRHVGSDESNHGRDMFPGDVRSCESFAIAAHAVSVFEPNDHGVTCMPKASRMAKRLRERNTELIEADG